MDKLLKELASIDAQLDLLLAHDELTAEQLVEHDKLVESRTKKVQAIERQKAAGERADETARLEAAAKLASRTVVGQNRLTTADAPTTPTRQHTDAQGRVTGYFEDTDEQFSLRVGNVAGAQTRQSFRQLQRRYNRELRTSGYVPWGEFKGAGDFIRAGLSGHQQQAFRERHQRHFAAAPLGMSDGVGSDGGYTVMPEFSLDILDRVYQNDLFSRTDNYPVSGNNMTFLANAETSRATGSRAGGLRGYWLGEGAALTPSKPTLREVNLKLLKLAVVVYLTDELLSDTGVALNEYVARKAAEEFNFLIGDGIFEGTGVGQPLGILNFPSLVSVATVAGQATKTLNTQNIVSMFQRLYAPNRANAVWLHNQDIEAQMFTLTLGIGTAGIATYMPPGGLSGTPYATLMGRPMLPIEFASTLGTQGDIAFADLGQILSISKGGVMQAVSLEIQFLTDQVAVRFIMRLNAGPWENSPITPFHGTNTQANFITLNSR